MKCIVLALSLTALSLSSQSPDKKLSLTSPLNQNDAWVLQQVLSQSNAGSNEGWAVDLSADGNTLAAGAPTFNNGNGITQIYSRSGTQWSHQTSLTQNVLSADEGASVALSADGNTLAAGSWGWKDSGATQIYNRLNTVWNYQTTLTQNLQGAGEGYSVAFSSNATVFAAGCIFAGNYEGATNIYVQSQNGWSYQTTLSQNQINSAEGMSVALSADGNTLAAGASGFSNSGGTQIYVKSANTWIYQATLSQLIENGGEGFRVALSADGNTLAAGAWNSVGATQIYVRSGSSWTHQATLTRNIAGSFESRSIGLSADGNTLAAGAPGYNNNSGALFMYTRSGTTWTYQTTLTQNSGDQEGFAAALSANATTLAAGSYFNPGATFVYIGN